MKLLLDTHILLWAASLWEITIKNQLGRDDFHVDPRLFRRALLDNGYTELPITSEHAITADIQVLFYAISQTK